MASGARELQRRIRSIGNTKKITKAMELVSAAKMRKAVEAVSQSKAYAKAIWELAINLSHRVNNKNPFFTPRYVKRATVVVISSNKGLCGGFNRQLTELVAAFGKDLKSKGADVSFITFGRKSAIALSSRGANLTFDFKKEDLVTSASELFPLRDKITSDFSKGESDAIYLSYTDFRSALKHVPVILPLLPIPKRSDPFLGLTHDAPNSQGSDETQNYEYKFEPSPGEVLDEIIPRLVEVTLFQAVLESQACEQSARMIAMKSATEAADEMESFLNLQYNRARQAGITREIAEISAGRIALNV